MAQEELCETVFIEEDSKEEKIDTILEQCFGIHFRIKEGVIEFYRKEEKLRRADDNP